MEFLDKISNLLQEKGLTQKDLTDHLGISKNVFTDWKAGRNKSYTKYVNEIATFLSVSADYLLGTPDDSASSKNAFTTPEGRKVVFLARHLNELSPENREKILKTFETTLDAFLQAEKGKGKGLPPEKDKGD